ncbi:peptidase M16 domain-containing protein [Enterobacter asburiae]|uniref:Peptidase M16 domain-containing protein n=1 Tax=Enterobacter asburiae TaxID=61645 RepID=A0A376FDA6_ENTAS|nr:peptidase M16 domain-containing protein [Enterobacter asburiae]
MAEIKQLTPQKVADFFHQAVIKPQGITILSQVSGSQNGKNGVREPERLESLEERQRAAAIYALE